MLSTIQVANGFSAYGFDRSATLGSHANPSDVAVVAKAKKMIRLSSKTINRRAYFLDLCAEDSQPKVYAGERDVRPPGAPTTQDPNRAAAHPRADGVRWV